MGGACLSVETVVCIGLLRPAPDQLALGGQPTADARWLTVVCRVASL
eukprot:COSAG01_NODE_63020_length_281_cov_5.835165_2_plen_46_part_01